MASVVARLDGFELSIANATALVGRAAALFGSTSENQQAIGLEQLLVACPTATPLVSVDGLSVHGGERTLVTGPSGSGKSTLFRAIAGIWPFGNGSITIPANATLMMLPQKPYFPIGSLRCGDRLSRRSRQPSATDRIREVLTQVGLPQLADAAERGGALEPDAVARRAAAARAGAGAVASAAIPVPGRGHRFAGRALGGGAVPLADREAAGHHHRLDRPPLDAATPSTSATSSWSATAIASRCRRPRPARQPSNGAS